MHRSSPVLRAVSAALSVAACASPTEEEDASVAGDEAAVTASNHADAVRACDQQFEADSSAADHTHAMIQASASLYDCVRAATSRRRSRRPARITLRATPSTIAPWTRPSRRRR
jgi:hypothetical protein